MPVRRREGLRHPQSPTTLTPGRTQASTDAAVPASADSRARETVGPSTSPAPAPAPAPARGRSASRAHTRCVRLRPRLFTAERHPSSGWMCRPAQSLSHIRICATPWTVARQAPLSTGTLQARNWSQLPCPPPGDRPSPGVKFSSPTMQVDSLPLRHHQDAE